MKQFLIKKKNAIAGVTACLLIGGVALSFQDTPFVNQILNEQPKQQDTVPAKNYSGSMKMKDFDRLLNGFDENMLQVTESIKKIDLTGIEKQLEQSLKSIDVEKIVKEVEGSLQKIDLDKIMQDVTASVAHIDWDNKQSELKQAFAEAKADMQKAREEMKNVKTLEIKKELENARQELAKSKDEFKKIDLEKIMNEARSSIQEAKKELAGIKKMFAEMEADGLINQKDGFSIEYKNKELFINGEKQKDSVRDKYRPYFKEDHFKITIEKE